MQAERLKGPRTPKTILEVKLVRETKELLGKFLDKFMALEEAAMFRSPVTPDIAPDYLDVIKHPMDLGLVCCHPREKTEVNKEEHGRQFSS